MIYKGNKKGCFDLGGKHEYRNMTREWKSECNSRWKISDFYYHADVGVVEFEARVVNFRFSFKVAVFQGFGKPLLIMWGKNSCFCTTDITRARISGFYHILRPKFSKCCKQWCKVTQFLVSWKPPSRYRFNECWGTRTYGSFLSMTFYLREIITIVSMLEWWKQGNLKKS